MILGRRKNTAIIGLILIGAILLCVLYGNFIFAKGSQLVDDCKEFVDQMILSQTNINTILYLISSLIIFIFLFVYKFSFCISLDRVRRRLVFAFYKFFDFFLYLFRKGILHSQIY